MNLEKNTILLTLIHKQEEYIVQTYPGQYYSLMTLISEYLQLPGFAICNGMGSCGTCMVNITEKHSRYDHYVLSCNTKIDDMLANCFIHIPDTFY